LSAAGPKVDPLIDIGNWLGRAGAPALDKSQRKSLKTLYDNEVKALDKPFQERFGVSLRSALGRQSRSNPELAAEVQRISNQLSDKLIASLHMDQQAPLRKYQSELVRVKRIELRKHTMASSGSSLSAEQEAEIDAVYARESYLRTLAIIEAAGESYENTLSLLAAQTNQRVDEILDRSSTHARSAVRTLD
jgi:hypothetical protein